MQPQLAFSIACDIVVAGGGLGGVAAAITGARAGLHVCMTEVTSWIGGQITSQGVSALDENKWIETTGATASYRRLRESIRAHYAPFLRPGQPQRELNPGACWVSGLCFEPKVAVHALEEAIAPLVRSGKLTLFLRTALVQATTRGGSLRSLLVYDLANRKLHRSNGKVFIDATELGDLLPLSGASFRQGTDARNETGEPDAPATSDLKALQSFTYPFALAPGSTSSLPVQKTAIYDRARNQFTFNVGNENGQPTHFGMFAITQGTPGSFWTYRRLIAHEQFSNARYPTDISMINWDSNDVCDSAYLSTDAVEQARAMQHGKQVSLAFAWWLQHEAPKDSGQGHGYPELSLRNDVIKTADGLSQLPYIRESRRMIALRIIREQDVAEPWQSGARAIAFDDTVGIGFYPIDIHSCGAAEKLPRSKPYQIAAGALVSRSVSNLLAGGKELGTTHIVNGGYRLQPTEWAIGEASGSIAVAALNKSVGAAELIRDPRALRKLQRDLLASGHPLVWFDDVPVWHAAFQAVQWAALTGTMPPDRRTLHFRPYETVTAEEVSAALAQRAKVERSANQELQGGRMSRAAFAIWLYQQSAGH